MNDYLKENISLIKLYLLNLWFSVSSSRFYFIVNTTYKGYGLRYLFNICFISSLIYVLYFGHIIIPIKNYLNHGIISPQIMLLDNIVNELPDIYYNGSSIKIAEETPYYINNSLVIDTKSSLIPYDYKNTLIVLTGHKLYINNIKNKSVILSLDYKSLLGNSPRKITGSILRTYLSQSLTNVESILVGVITPLIILARFISILVMKLSIIIPTYLLCNLFRINSFSFKQICRIIVFSSAPAYALEPILLLIPKFYYIYQFLKLLPNLLAFWALWNYGKL